MKKIISILVCLVLVVSCLTACQSKDTKTGDSANKQKTEQPKAEQKAKKKSTVKKETKKASNQKATENDDSHSQDEDSNNDTASKEGNSSSQNKKSKSITSKPSSKKTTKVCYITISAAEVKGSGKLPEGIDRVIPSGGTILKSTKITLKDGDTVKTVLSRASANAGIVVSNPSGSYVEGIGGLFEKDAGAKSGWMYSVNGKFIQDACSDVKIYSGDIIKWEYTCNLGKDL